MFFNDRILYETYTRHTYIHLTNFVGLLKKQLNMLRLPGKSIKNLDMQRLAFMCELVKLFRTIIIVQSLYAFNKFSLIFRSSKGRRF